jgi:uncharacterized membrane protein YoaK (UPF0700 family)
VRYKEPVNRYDRRIRALATCLSALAGYVDAIGFIKLGGFFVSFMSGNSTRLGVGLAQGSHHAVVAGGLIGAFVLGVILGSLAGHIARGYRQAAVLGVVAFLLASAASLNMVGATSLAVAATALAMGAGNAVFEHNGEVQIGLTYMTGTLVKLGQRLSAALVGGDRLAWAPYLFLWLGLVSGACAGAAIYPYLGLNGLWIAAGVAAAMALAVARTPANAI